MNESNSLIYSTARSTICLVDYGDARALPWLHEALDAYAVANFIDLEALGHPPQERQRLTGRAQILAPPLPTRRI